MNPNSRFSQLAAYSDTSCLPPTTNSKMSKRFIYAKGIILESSRNFSTLLIMQECSQVLVLIFQHGHTNENGITSIKVVGWNITRGYMRLGWHE